MALRSITASWCCRVLFLGLAAALVTYVFLAVTGIARVSHRLPLLIKAQRSSNFAAVGLLNRLAQSHPGVIPNSSSRPITQKLVEKFRRTSVTKSEREWHRPSERKEGVNGRPLSEKARRTFSDLTRIPFMEDPHYQPSTCPKTVLSIAKHSRWFGQRYKERIKLFLDHEDIDNFTKVSKHVPPFGYAGQSKELFEEIVMHPKFTNAPVNAEGTRKQCLRCAVVGCGGILKDSGAGREIDSHDYVFRLNRAVTGGRFAKDVGTKTNFYIFFPESMSVQNTLNKNTTFIYTIFKTYDMKYVVTMLDNENPPPYISGGQRYLIPKPNVDPARLKIVHPDFFRYVFAEYLDAVAYRPTTGAMVVFLSLHMCDEVTIYGFGYDPRFTMHYYDTSFVRLSDISTGSHDVDNERHLWDKLHQEGTIRLFRRDV